MTCATSGPAHNDPATSGQTVFPSCGSKPPRLRVCEWRFPGLRSWRRAVRPAHRRRCSASVHPSHSLSGPREGVPGPALSFPGQRVYESARMPAPSAPGSPRPAQGLSPRDGPGDCCTDEGARSLPFSDDSSIFRGVNVLYCPLVYLQ